MPARLLFTLQGTARVAESGRRGGLSIHFPHRSTGSSPVPRTASQRLDPLTLCPGASSDMRTESVAARITRAPLAALPTERRAIRHLGRTAIAAEIRALLRTLGITGVSVTCPRGACVHIRIPTIDCGHRDIMVPPYRHRATCRVCAEGHAAERRIEYILGAAFDIEDRSDTQSDYFNFVYLIHQTRDHAETRDVAA